MDKKDTDIRKILKKMKPSDFIYLGVIFVFFIIVVILFSYSTGFIIKNVNKIFSSDKETNTQLLDVPRYTLIAKKLNLPINTISENTPSQEPLPPASEPETENDSAITDVNNTTQDPVANIPELDKSLITINVLNSTSKKSIASVLAQVFKDAGFPNVKSGNEKILYENTTIVIKETRKEYSPLIEQLVLVSYPKATTKIVTDKYDFDVTVIIGKD
ncbi:MAG: LytR C-terminal domain-containing protein [bacterium]